MSRCFVSGMCCDVDVSASDCSLVERNRTEFGVFNSV